MDSLNHDLSSVSPSGPAIVSEIDVGSAEFKRNRETMQQLLTQWRERVAVVKAGGGTEIVQKHKARGKLTARE